MLRVGMEKKIMKSEAFWSLFYVVEHKEMKDMTKMTLIAEDSGFLHVECGFIYLIFVTA